MHSLSIPIRIQNQHSLWLQLKLGGFNSEPLCATAGKLAGTKPAGDQNSIVKFSWGLSTSDC